MILIQGEPQLAILLRAPGERHGVKKVQKILISPIFTLKRSTFACVDIFGENFHVVLY